MQKKSFKFLAMTLVVLMAVSMFAACGSQSTPPASSSSTAATTESSGSESSEALPEEFPLSQLSVEVFDRANENGTDPTNNYWTDWIKEQALEALNIEVSFVSVPRSEEVAQLNVLMAGGNPPDVVFTYTKSVAYNYYKQGGLADLTDAIDQYAPTMKSYLGEDILYYGQFDGRQYMVPAKRISLATYNTFMRKDWLDKLGLEVPQNMDEFYNALVAFKEHNPGGVDKVIPYSMHGTGFNYNAGNILDSFTEIANMTEEEIFVNGLSLNSSSTNLLYTGFKDGVRFLNKLYNEGLFDAEFALHSNFSEVEDLIMRGQVGSWASNYDEPIRTSPGVYNQLKGNVPDAEIIALDCFINTADGSKMRQIYSPHGVFNFVPASSGNIEGAVRYMDWLCSDDVRTMLVCGEEGVNHTKDENGIPVMINLQNDPKMMNSPNNLDYALIVNGVDLGDQEKNLLAISKSYEEQYVDWFLNAYHTALNDGTVYNRLSIPFDSEAQYITTLNDKRNEILSNAISASIENFDRVYDAGIQEFLAVGGQACIDERQAYWDANMK